MKNFIEKDKSLGIDLIVGLLKFWPITNPAKEVVYITEIEEILDLCNQEAHQKFLMFGPKLLKRLVATSQNMHYQAAERALLLLNNEVIHKLVKANLVKAYPIIVKGLINANRGPNQHWNPTVNTITMTVMRSYMEINRDMFEKLSASN
jgi:serine/threonine-protein phosphatase 2A regulatory subunit B'